MENNDVNKSCNRPDDKKASTSETNSNNRAHVRCAHSTDSEKEANGSENDTQEHHAKMDEPEVGDFDSANKVFEHSGKETTRSENSKPYAKAVEAESYSFPRGQTSNYPLIQKYSDINRNGNNSSHDSGISSSTTQETTSMPSTDQYCTSTTFESKSFTQNKSIGDEKETLLVQELKQQLYNKSKETSDYANENVKFYNQIRELESENSNLKNTYNNIVNQLFETLKNKQSSWETFATKYLWKKNDDILTKINFIQSTLNEQSSDFARQANDLSTCRQELNNIRNEKENLERSFSNKSQSQQQQLKEADIKYKSAKAEANKYKEEIGEVKVLLKNSEKQCDWYKEELMKSKINLKQINKRNASLSSNLENLNYSNKKNHGNILELEARVLLLQKCLKKEQDCSKQCKIDSEIAQRLLKEQQQHHSQLKDNLETQHQDLENQEEYFRESFQIYRKLLSHYIVQVSPDDISKQVEDNSINGATGKISKIKEDIKQYEDQIERFEGNRESKTYLHIKEMLQRAIEQLDAVETERKKEIHEPRKQAISYAKQMLEYLQNKVKSK